MKIYQINYKRLVRLLLPTMLRQTLYIAFLDALIAPIVAVHYWFLSFRDSSLYRLKITPQVCYLDKLLNDRFDGTQRRIHITDGVFLESTYIYTQDEGIDSYLFTESENKDEYLYTSAESGSESVDFIVNIPRAVTFDVQELTALLNIYKLASKTYKISII